MNTFLTIISEIVYTLCVVAVLNLNLIPIFSFVATITLCCADLMNCFKKTNEDILKLSENPFVKLLLFGDPKYNHIDNCHILNASVNFLLRSGRFLKVVLCRICLTFFYYIFPFAILWWPYCLLKYTVSEWNFYCWWFYLLLRIYFFYLHIF